MKEKPEFPDFKLISKLGKNKIKSQFPKYGNSWKMVPINPNWEWWQKRLQGEIKEIFKSDNAIEREKEIIDAINILAFMFENNHIVAEMEHDTYQRTWRYG